MKLNSQLNSRTASKLKQNLTDGARRTAAASLTVATALMVLAPLAAWATTPALPEWEQRETVVHRTSHQLTVELNETTVVCSRADYTVPMLKVLIPGLADITLLNHQNTGAGAPCMTTGEKCGAVWDFENKRTPMERIGGGPGTEVIVVEVTEKRQTSINHKDKTCEVYLLEELKTNLRGKEWFHAAETRLGQRPYSDCR